MVVSYKKLCILETVWNFQFPGFELQSPLIYFVKNQLILIFECAVVGTADEVVNRFVVPYPLGYIPSASLFEMPLMTYIKPFC
jgi:hypothetical protein